MRPIPCRFHQRPVVFYGSGDALERIIQPLHEASLEVVRAIEIDAIDGLAPEDGPCIIDAEAIGGQDQLPKFLLSRPDMTKVLVTTGSPTHAWILSSAQVHLLFVRMSRDRDRLPALVIGERIRHWTRHLCLRVDRTVQVDPRIRKGISSILCCRVSRKHGHLPHTKGAIAEHVGCSPRTLTRIEQARGRRLRPVADVWAAFLALIEHEVHRVKWEPVALRMGYAGLSGLTRLLDRALGAGPATLSGGGIEPGIQREEVELRRTLSACRRQA
jgi:hypothetical protein